MKEKTMWLACAMVLLAAGCAQTPSIYEFKRDGFDFSRCDPAESGYAWCDARDRAKRWERIKL